MRTLLLFTLTALAAGCGGSAPATPSAAETTCERHWSPAASSTGSFKIATLTKAAGPPDSLEPLPNKNIYGKPMGWTRYSWDDGNGTAVIVSHGEVVAAICDLASVPSDDR